MARALNEQEALPVSVRQEADAWLERDRGWQDELASVPALTGARGLEAHPAERRAAAQLPAVAEAVRLETDRLARLPLLKEGIAWTGDAPLVAGDRLAFQAQGRTWQAAVVSPEFERTVPDLAGLADDLKTAWNAPGVIADGG